MLGAPGSEECAENLQILQRVGKNLGVPPDTHHQELRLPREKPERILVLLLTGNGKSRIQAGS